MKYKPFRLIVQLGSFLFLNMLLFNYLFSRWYFTYHYLPFPILIGITSDLSATTGLFDVLQVTISQSIIPFSALAFMFIIGSIFGKAFCGWVCPIGFIQDLISTISSGDTQISKQDDAIGKKIKYVLLAIVLVLTGAFGIARAVEVGEAYLQSLGIFANGPFIPLSPDNILFGEIPQIIMQGGTSLTRSILALFIVQGLILVILFWGAASITRFWCRYICPLGGLMALFSRVSLLGLKRHPTKCQRCPSCEKACIMQVKILEKSWRKLNDNDCILCMECADACPHNAIHPTI